MTRQLRIPRLLAATTAIAVATWGIVTEPATADPGQGQGQGQGPGQGQGQTSPPGQATDGPGKGPGKGPDTDGKDDKGPTPGQGHAHGHGHAPGQQDGAAPGAAQGPRGHDQGGAAGGPDDSGSGGSGDSDDGAGTQGDPAGNNGTVKITPVGEDDGIPQNSPHAVCGVDIEWYGFDEGPDVVSTVTFTPQAPTADVTISGTDPAQVFVGGDPASGAGTATGLDGEATYYLAFEGEPHPQQGYHVKVTVSTPRSQGADVKHKVFWFEPCAPPATSTAVPPSPVESAEPTEPSDEPDRGVLGISTSVDEPAALATAPDVPNAVAAGAGGDEPLAGAVTPWSLSLLGLALLALGALVVRRRHA
jgi:hypothetical protein